MNTELPTSVRIGKKRYKIEFPDHLPNPLVVGNIAFASNTIKIASRSNKPLRKRSQRARLATFWHEVVHGILYDMGSRKNSDEIFVGAFAKRIVQVLESAKFEA